jgi:hypothetical protein
MVLADGFEDVEMHMGYAESFGLTAGRDQGIIRNSTLAKIDARERENGLWWSNEAESKMDEEEKPFMDAKEEYDRQSEYKDSSYLHKQQKKYEAEKNKGIQKLKKLGLTSKYSDPDDKKSDAELVVNDGGDDMYYHPRHHRNQRKPQAVEVVTSDTASKDPKGLAKQKVIDTDETMEDYVDYISDKSRKKSKLSKKDFDYLSADIDMFIDDADNTMNKNDPRYKTVEKKAGLKLKILLGQIWDWNKELDESIKRDIEDHQGHSYLDALRDDSRLGDTCEGEILFNKGLDAVIKMAKAVNIDPSQIQKDFIKSIFEVCLPHIYKDDFPRFKHVLLKRLNRKEFQRGAFLTCPRQLGKTTMIFSRSIHCANCNCVYFIQTHIIIITNK